MKSFEALTIDDCCVRVGETDKGKPLFCGRPRHAGFTLCHQHTHELYEPVLLANQILDAVRIREEKQPEVTA